MCPYPHSPDPCPSWRLGSDWTLIRSYVLNPVVPASLHFHCYEDKGRYKAHRSPRSLHLTSFAHYCRHGNSLPRSPLDDLSQSMCTDKYNVFFFSLVWKRRVQHVAVFWLWLQEGVGSLLLASAINALLIAADLKLSLWPLMCHSTPFCEEMKSHNAEAVYPIFQQLVKPHLAAKVSIIFCKTVSESNMQVLFMYSILLWFPNSLLVMLRTGETKWWTRCRQFILSPLRFSLVRRFHRPKIKNFSSVLNSLELMRLVILELNYKLLSAVQVPSENLQTAF